VTLKLGETTKDSQHQLAVGCGCVSPRSLSDLKAAPAAPTTANVLSKSLVDRASLSSLQTTSVSPSARAPIAFASARNLLTVDLSATSIPQRCFLSRKALAVCRYSRISNRCHFAPNICNVEVVDVCGFWFCASLEIFALGKRQRAKPGQVAIASAASAMSTARC